MGLKLPSICAVDEEIQNQNGVVFFTNLKDATKIVLVKWGVNSIGYSLNT